MDDAERWLQVFGLGPDATQQQIESAYRDLVKVWHPDRFQSDPRLRLKAEEKLRELNDAYDHLLRRPRAPRADPSTTGRAQVRPEPQTSESPAVPKGYLNSRGREIRTFAGVSIAAAAVVGALLFLGGRRGTITPSDEILVADPPPYQARPAAAQRSEPETPESISPAPTTGMLTVFSQPSGATVYFNDQKVGQTPLNLTAVVPGEHRIRLELDDDRVWSSAVRVEAGSGEKLLAIFEK